MCTTRDLDQAQQMISALYYPHQLDTATGRAFDVALNAVVSGGLTLGHATFGADTRIDAPTLHSCYQVNLTLSGRTTVHLHRRREKVSTEAGKRGVIFTPADAVSLEWQANASQFVVKIPAAVLHDHLTGLLGGPLDGSIDFAPGLDLGSAAGGRLGSAVRYYASEIDRGDGRLNSILEGQLEKLIMTSLLFCTPHRYARKLVAEPRSVRPRVVQRALDFIEGHLAEPIGLADIARAAGVSARALQIAFRRHLGSTPMTVIRDLRLTRVHEELRRSAPESATVGRIATRWGFAHQGRFGQQYRERYGCSPGETLRKHW